MTGSQTLQLVGSVAILVLATGLGWIGWHHQAYGRYGREALLCISAYLVTTVVVRVFALLEAVSMTDARTINGLLAFAFVAILAQIILVKRKDYKQ